MSGAALGGIAACSTVTVATSTDRFIVDASKRTDLGDVEVVHDLRDEIGTAVVTGSESSVDSLGVAYAPDTRYSIDQPLDDQATPSAEEATDETLYPLQWDKQAQDVPSAHEVTRGEGTRVAIVDTGVYSEHPDLQHAVNTSLSRDFTGDGYGANLPVGGYHGTHVAGIVAADDQNDTGVVGTAPGTEIVDCRVFSTGPYADFGDMLAALVYSASIGCDAANMSIGAYPVLRQAIGSFYGKVLNRTVTYANSQGTLLVVSAGNSAADLQHDAYFISLPNESAQALSVSATGPIGFNWGDAGLEAPAVSPAFYTNYGTNAIDIGAPGGNADLAAADAEVPGWYFDLVLSSIAEPNYAATPDPDAPPTYEGVGEVGYGWAAGTSMAAPQVTGAAALVASLYNGSPKSKASTIENVLKRTATVPAGFDKTYYGSGFLNPVAAVREMQ